MGSNSRSAVWFPEVDPTPGDVNNGTTGARAMHLPKLCDKPVIAPRSLSTKSPELTGPKVS
jgi:hypothetical protein